MAVFAGAEEEETALVFSPPQTRKIIPGSRLRRACAALHNFSQNLNDPLPQESQVVQPQSSASPAPAAAIGSTTGKPALVDTEDRFRACRRIIRDY
ncbi:hypothetical protein MTO96_003033 [Rhipicephalus appendiculatus]